MANIETGSVTLNIHLARPENVKVELDRIADMRVIVITQTFCEDVTRIRLFEDRANPKSFDALVKFFAHSFAELMIPELEPLPEPTGGIVRSGGGAVDARGCCPVTGYCDTCPLLDACSDPVER